MNPTNNKERIDEFKDVSGSYSNRRRNEIFRTNKRRKFTLSGGGLNLRKVMIEMYSIKHAEKNTYALINSHKELAESNNKHAKAMRYLTGALVLVAVAQVIVATLSLFRL